jgi:excisionase family DNA binding protein
LLTVSDAAQRAGVSRHTIGSWITAGKLSTLRIAGRRYARPADLAATQETAHVGDMVPRWRQDRRHAGWRLRQLREAAGMTQLELAAASGLRHETLSRLELGRQGASAESVRALAQALAVDPEQFVGREPVGRTRLTVTEAAARLEVPAARIETWLQQGRLAGVKVSGQWRVPAIAVTALERSGRLRGRCRRFDPRYRGWAQEFGPASERRACAGEWITMLALVLLIPAGLLAIASSPPNVRQFTSHIGDCRGWDNVHADLAPVNDDVAAFWDDLDRTLNPGSDDARRWAYAAQAISRQFETLNHSPALSRYVDLSAEIYRGYGQGFSALAQGDQVQGDALLAAGDRTLALADAALNAANAQCAA